MPIQVGTVDGLINITDKIKTCFVEAIDKFNKEVISPGSLNNLSIGDAFQRYTYPVYSGTATDYTITSLGSEVKTKTGNKQSPAYVTYCKKMGLLKTEGSTVFELTPLGKALKDSDITLEEYALVYMSKQGVFVNGKCKGNLLVDIAEFFNKNSYITTDLLKSFIAKKYGTADFEKTRFDIILGALDAAKLLTLTNKTYVLSGIYQASILKYFYEKRGLISISLLDSDDDYSSYIGDFKNGIFDVLDKSNINLIQEEYPNLVKYIKYINNDSDKDQPLQKISYGAPGTGKSNGIKQYFTKNNIDEKTQVIRTTFHPDSDYSTFVGSYKPTMEKKAVRNLIGHIVKENGSEVYEPSIVYTFVPQAFLKAYVAAWKNQEQNMFLVIEEINRGNCAQIFGDIFQLLDRKDNGESEYPIKADQDIQNYLAEVFADCDTLPENIKSGEELVLPSNLYIWATMNTSDQSLFPIDSAFKRRWDWEYVPIKYANGNWVIEIGNIRYSWVSFQKNVNKKVYDINHSEDKMLGDFFVKANDQDVITEKVLINKILFYLWNDVCKDGEGDIFKKDANTDLTFSDLYGSNGTNNLIAMMEYLGVEKIEDDDMDENDETNSDTQGGKGKHPKYSINGSTEVYSTPKSVLKIINDFAQDHLDMSVQEMIENWNRIANRNDFLIESWEPSPTDNSKTPRRIAIKWNDKTVWVARGWTEELFQTFIENVKKELDIDIVKVN